MKRMVAVAVMALVAWRAEAASHVKVGPPKKKDAAAAESAGRGMPFVVTNEERFPVDVCLTDALTGSGKVEVSPFYLEQQGREGWGRVDGPKGTTRFAAPVTSGQSQTFFITVREPGKYRVMLEYGRAAAGDKGCDTLFKGLTTVVRSKAFEVR